MGNVMHEKLTSISGHVCNRLLSIGEDGFGTRRMAIFCKLFRRLKGPERKFPPFRDYLCTKDAKYKGGWPSMQCQEAIVFRRSHGSRSPGLVHIVSMSLYQSMTKKKLSCVLTHYLPNIYLNLES